MRSSIGVEGLDGEGVNDEIVVGVTDNDSGFSARNLLLPDASPSDSSGGRF